MAIRVFQINDPRFLFFKRNYMIYYHLCKQVFRLMWRDLQLAIIDAHGEIHLGRYTERILFVYSVIVFVKVGAG